MNINLLRLSRKINWNIIILLISLVIFLSLQLLFFHHMIDDSFISFRYSENLVSHGELNWNVGEDPVEGYSNFLWVIIATIPLLLSLNVYFFMKIVGLFFGLASIIALYKLSKEVSNEFNWYPALFLSLSYPFALWSVSAMETSLFTFLLIVSLLYFIRELKEGTGWKSSILFLFLALTRSEGAVIFLASIIFRVTYFYLINREKEDIKEDTKEGIKEGGVNIRNVCPLIKGIIYQLKKNLIWMVVFLIPYSTYFFWRISYYGFFFPNTYYVKKLTFGGLSYIFGTVLIFLPFIMVGLFYLIRNKNWKWTYLFIVQFVFILTFLNINPVMGNILRYVIPIIPLFALPISLVFEETVVKRSKILKVIFLISFLSMISINLINITDNYSITKTYVENIENVNIPLGMSLANQNMTIALGDCGVIPFYSKSNIIDILSLNDEYLAHNEFSSDYVLDQKPEIIILRVASDNETDFIPFGEENLLIYNNPKLYEFYDLDQIIPMYKQVKRKEYWYWVYKLI